MIRIFDSMSKTKKILTNDNTANLYLCGPTVYNYIHIGNIRPVIIFDVLHRLLLQHKYQINYVHNITDIDDKIIHQAEKEQTTEAKLSEKYFQAYCHDLKKLNILLPTKMPKVTDYISENINFIIDLIKKKYAYVADGDVYFSVSKIPSYGALAHKNIGDLQPNARVNNKKNKNLTFDFALWKDTTVGVNWESPWSKGRPGWHTECVVFIKQIFAGKTINLHGGGVDLKFPHHENERAQFLAATNHELANIWWHNGHINLASQKMSKSLNNIILVKDFCQKYHPFVLRYLILNHDHQQPIDFSEQLVIEAVSTIKKYQDILQIWSYHSFINETAIITNQYHQEYYETAINYLSDNINTTNTFTLLSKIIKELNQAVSSKNFSAKQQKLFATLVFILELLGFNFTFGNYSETTKAKIKTWEALKANKDFHQADAIRQELQTLGVLPKN